MKKYCFLLVNEYGFTTYKTIISGYTYANCLDYLIFTLGNADRILKVWRIA